MQGKIEIENILIKTKQASSNLMNLTSDIITATLKDLAKELIVMETEILKENEKDLTTFLEKNNKNNPMYDRLLLNSKRINEISNQVNDIATANFSVEKNQLEEKILPSGIILKKISVPFGVIAVIYESRPNVTIDVFSLCFKTQNACILRGGRETYYTNKVLIKIIKEVLLRHNINTDIANLITCERESVISILTANKQIDLCIPRGGKNLIEFVKKNATVPVLETGAGVVHAYFSQYGNIEIGKKIIENSKTRRVSVCNALDCLIINESRLAELPALIQPLENKNVILYCDESSYNILQNKYQYLEKVSENEIAKEFLDYKMSIITSKNLNDAIEYINTHTSSHSECIISDNQGEIKDFEKYVDAAVIYTNTSTAFTDGAEFGMGAEIGISTQKLHARGPVALEGLRIIKYLVHSNGITRG